VGVERDINADPFRKREHVAPEKLDPTGNALDFRKEFGLLFRELDPIGNRIISVETNRRHFERQIGYLLATAKRGPDEGGTLVELLPRAPLDNDPTNLSQPDVEERVLAAA
jgi:hypothetical protein